MRRLGKGTLVGVLFIVMFIGNEFSLAGAPSRGGSVCLNRFRGVLKWISASVMLPPGLVTAH